VWATRLHPPFLILMDVTMPVPDDHNPFVLPPFILSHQSTTEECMLPVSEDSGCGSVNPEGQATSEGSTPSGIWANAALGTVVSAWQLWLVIYLGKILLEDIANSTPGYGSYAHGGWSAMGSTRYADGKRSQVSIAYSLWMVE